MIRDNMSIADPKRQLEESAVNRTIPGVRIVSTGICIPDNEVFNEDLAELGYDSDWIIQRTGIRSRRHVVADQATSDLALGAARNCLASAGVQPAEVDLIVVATMTPDHYAPSTACIVQGKLGCQAAAVDMNAACSGFVYALITASHFVRNGASKKALVIGAETMSMVVDPLDKKTFPLFGDGAGAVLLERDSNTDPDQASGFLAYRLASAGELGESLVIPGCGSRMPASQEVIDNRDQFLKMDGRTVFKWAVRLIPEIVHEMLQIANLELGQLDLLLFHQANERIINAATEDLEIDHSKVYVNLDRYGNTSAASIPISIHEARLGGRMNRGDLVLLAGFGAGLTWAGSILRY